MIRNAPFILSRTFHHRRVVHPEVIDRQVLRDGRVAFVKALCIDVYLDILLPVLDERVA